MRGKLGRQLAGNGFAVEPLLQHIKRLHAPFPHDQKLAIDRARQTQSFDQIGKALGDILAGARIKPPDGVAVARRRDRLHADAVPLPLGHEIGGVESGEVRFVECMRQHGRPKRHWIAARRLFGAPFEPGEKLDIRRHQTGPQQLDVLRIGSAECRDRSFGEP
jgi:hypothetical protein